MNDDETPRGPLSFDDDEEREARLARREDPDWREERLSGRPPPQRRPATGRYGWAIGVVSVIFLGVVLLNSFRTEGPGSSGLEEGRPLPPFAMPLATSDLGGDANIATRDDDDDDRGKVPACTVRGRKILNICELAERGPVVLAFLATRGANCEPQLDRMERLRGAFPGVQFAAVGIRGDRGDLRELVRERRWRFPVGYDRDGVVVNLYGVAGCPTTVFAYAGGIVKETTLGDLDEAELRTKVRRLVRESRARGWSPPSA